LVHPDINIRYGLTLTTVEIDLRTVSSDCLLTALNRDDVLKLLPKNGSAIEIGVNRGAYSQKIVDRATPRVLHLIDPWPVDQSDEYISTYRVKDDMEVHYAQVLSTFSSQLETGQVVIHRAYSSECVSNFVDGTFDFIYVDGMHSYDACLRDLTLYSPKLKSTGILMGHDFSNTTTGRRKLFGVVRAVSDFLERSDFMPVLVTLENAPSFMLTRHHATRDRMVTSALLKAPGLLTPFRTLAQMEQIGMPLDDRGKKAEVMRI
jgi:Methyltransferase domain